MSRSTFVPYINNFINNLRTERWHYSAIVGLVVLLSLLLIYQLLLSFYNIGELIATSHDQINKIASLENSIHVGANNIPTAVTDWHIFGDAPVLLNNSNYSLLGIDYSPDQPDQAKVFLSTNNGEPIIYKVGDRLPDGVIVQSVSQNDVTLLRDGVPQKLSLVWESNGGGTPATPQPYLNLPQYNNINANVPANFGNGQNMRQFQWQMRQ